MKKVFGSILALMIITAGTPVLSAETPDSVTEKTPELSTKDAGMAIREKLSPIVSALLEMHCGQDCPGFRIDPQIKTVSNRVLDNLGFTRSKQSTSTPELKSVLLTVLVNNKLSEGDRKSLQQIMLYQLANDCPVPLTVQLKKIGGISPNLKKTEEGDRPLVEIKDLIWPVCLVTLGLLVLIGLILGLVLVTRGRIKHLRERAELFRRIKEGIGKANETSGKTSEETEFSKIFPVNENPEQEYLLKTYRDDLKWLVEKLALDQDFTNLRKITSIFEPKKLSQSLQLSPVGLKSLTALSLASTTEGEKLSLKWLKTQLDQAHWRRVAELELPLMKLSRLQDGQLSKLFSSLKSLQQKAACLCNIEQDKWPLLMSQLGSEEKIQLGIALYNYQNEIIENRHKMDTELGATIEALWQNRASADENPIDMYPVFLSDSEGHTLASELKLDSIFSVDKLVSETQAEALVEICTKMELVSLKALLSQLSQDLSKKLLSQLPGTLQKRLLSLELKLTEATKIKARADFIKAYRSLELEELQK